MNGIISNNNNNFGENVTKKLQSLPYTIIINGNTDLLNNSLTNGWSGTGTLLDPIVIKNSVFASFSISNTNLYIQMINDTISNSANGGLDMYNVTHVFISSCRFENNYNAIHFTTVTNVTVQDSIIQRNERGIFGDAITNTTFLNNLVKDNVYFGFDFGMGLYWVYKYCSLINNTLINNSFLGLQHFYKMTGNTIDGKTIQYSDTSNETLAPLPNVSLLIVYASNVTIKNFNLTNGLYYTGAYSTIENNTIIGSYGKRDIYGIYVDLSSFNTFKNNYISNHEFGFVANFCFNNTIEANIIVNSTSHYGFLQHNGQFSNNTLLNNKLINNKIEVREDDYGVFMNGIGNNTYINNTYNNHLILVLIEKNNLVYSNLTLGEALVLYSTNITLTDCNLDITTIRHSDIIRIDHSTIQISNKDENSFYFDSYYNYNESVLQYGIMIGNSSIQLDSNIFKGNMRDIYSHYENGNLSLTIINNVFKSSQDAIMMESPGNFMIQNNTFENNNDSIQMTSPYPTLIRSNYTISQNYFDYDNYCITNLDSNYHDEYLTVLQNVFQNNEVIFNGTLGGNVSLNDFINNKQIYDYHYGAQINNFYYPYLTTMQDANGDNISDQLVRVDQAGLFYVWEYVRTVPNVVKDTFAPQFSTNLVNDSIYHDQMLPITYIFSEKVNISLSLDGGNPLYANSLSSINLNDGKHNLLFTVQDMSHNEITSNISFIVDTKSPYLLLNGFPGDNSYTNSTSLTYSYFVHDENGPVNVQVYINNVNRWEQNNSVIPLNDGNYNFTVTASDATGNTTTISRFFTVDTTKPTINYNFNSIDNKTINFTFNATDANGISSYSILLNNKVINLVMNSATKLDLEQNKYNIITIIVTDNANNTRVINITIYSVLVNQSTITFQTSISQTSLPSQNSISTQESKNSESLSTTQSISTSEGFEIYLLLFCVLAIGLYKRKFKN